MVAPKISPLYSTNNRSNVLRCAARSTFFFKYFNTAFSHLDFSPGVTSPHAFLLYLRWWEREQHHEQWWQKRTKWGTTTYPFSNRPVAGFTFGNEHIQFRIHCGKRTVEACHLLRRHPCSGVLCPWQFVQCHVFCHVDTYVKGGSDFGIFCRASHRPKSVIHWQRRWVRDVPSVKNRM